MLVVIIKQKENGFYVLLKWRDIQLKKSKAENGFKWVNGFVCSACIATCLGKGFISLVSNLHREMSLPSGNRLAAM